MNWLKKVLSTNGTGGFLTSLGVMGPLLSGVMMIINTVFGAGTEIISQGDIDQIVSSGNAIVNAISAVTGVVTGIVGRWRATRKIGGGELA